MKKYSICLALTCSILACFSGCGLRLFGDLPAWPGQATIEIALPDYPEDSGRAVAPGGRLYIRAIGGPDYSFKTLVGPLVPKNGTVSVTSFPPGNYTNLLILHSIRTHDTELLTYLGQPDNQLLADLAKPEGNRALDELVNGYGSAAQTGPTTITPGTNTITRTLVPVCSTGFMINMVYNDTNDEANGEIDIDFAGSSVRRFLSLRFNDIPDTWAEMLISLETPGTPQMYVFNASGKPLGPLTHVSDGFWNIPVKANENQLYVFLDTALSGLFKVLSREYRSQIEIEGLRNYSDPGPVILANNETIGFNDVGYGSNSIGYTISNNGNKPLVISSAKINGTNADNFLHDLPSSKTLPPGENHSFTIQLFWIAGSSGGKTAKLTISSNDPDEPQFIMNLQGSTS